MTILAKKLKPFLPKLGILLLLFSFGALTGFSTVLHAHELDFGSVHDDCAPCHWSQSNQTDETDAPGVETPTVRQFFQLIPAEGIENTFINKPSNRGPPALS